MTLNEQPDFAHTHPEVYDMANGGGGAPITEQPAIVGGVDAVDRYHFTDEQPFLVATDQGEQKLDSGWLAITEKEYAALTARPSAPAEVEPGSEREAAFALADRLRRGRLIERLPSVVYEDVEYSGGEIRENAHPDAIAAADMIDRILARPAADDAK